MLLDTYTAQKFKANSPKSAKKLMTKSVSTKFKKKMHHPAYIKNLKTTEQRV